MRHRWVAWTTGVLAVVLGFSTCATQSVIEGTWELPGYASQEFSNVAVIAVMRNASESKAFEGLLVPCDPDDPKPRLLGDTEHVPRGNDSLPSVRPQAPVDGDIQDVRSER